MRRSCKQSNVGKALSPLRSLGPPFLLLCRTRGSYLSYQYISSPSLIDGCFIGGLSLSPCMSTYQLSFTFLVLLISLLPFLLSSSSSCPHSVSFRLSSESKSRWFILPVPKKHKQGTGRIWHSVDIGGVAVFAFILSKLRLAKLPLHSVIQTLKDRRPSSRGSSTRPRVPFLYQCSTRLAINRSLHPENISIVT